MLLPLLMAISLLAPADNPTPIQLDKAASAFAEARSLSETDAKALWGVPLYGPLLFVEPGSRFIVANQADAEGRLSLRDGVFVGELPPDQNIANTAVQWAGVRWTMVIWPLPDAVTSRRCLLAHEMWHRVQDQIGLPLGNPGNAHLDGRDGRFWLRLEWRALRRALLADEPERRDAVQDALAFRAARRQHCGPAAATDENALELNEGLAEYTGFALCGLPEWARRDRVALRLEEQEWKPTFVRNFAYASGPAYGTLLDLAGDDWRRNLRPGMDLGALLAQAYHCSDHADAETRAAGYDGAPLTAAEDERQRTMNERLAAARARYFDGPVLIIELSPNVGYSFNPNQVTSYDEASSVYEGARLSDSWGVLEASGGVMLTRRDGAMREARVPAPTGKDLVSGPDWTLQLNDGVSVEPGTRAGDFVIRRK